MKAARWRLKFQTLPGRYAVCRFGPKEPVPEWVKGPFCSITRTEEELSVICPTRCVPAGVEAARDWRVLKLIGPFPLSAVGVAAAVTGALARAGVGLLALSTHDTDYFLVRSRNLTRAVRALISAGHAQVS
jgi:hypothetical protein